MCCAMWPTASWGSSPRRLIVSTLLLKLSKHTALLVSLLVLGKATGRYDLGETTLLGLAIAAASLHLGARALVQHVEARGGREEGPRPMDQAPSGNALSAAADGFVP